MKIGILTHPLMYNYGGILQNYALQSVLKDMGHEAVTIDRRPCFHYGVSLYAVWAYLSRFYKNVVNHKVTRWNPNLPVNKKEYDIISANINTFINGHIDRTEPSLDSTLEEVDRKHQFDCYVVGSDQVWLSGCCPLMFVNFSKRENVRKVFYAASAGERSWMDDVSKAGQCQELSKGFQAISVREDALKAAAEKMLSREVSVVLDPTMLLEPGRYFPKGYCLDDSHDHIFAYILDNNKLKESIISEASSELGAPVVSGFTIDSSKRIKTSLPGVEDWLRQIHSAKYVITDSFHGCAFAILFKKQFSVVINESRGRNRFSTLLSRFNLQNRVVTSPESLIETINTPIDYTSIESILQEWRHVSLQFLTSALIN